MRIVLVTLSTLLISSAFATKIGIGVSAQDDGGTIYVPVDISDKLRVEPALFVYRSDYEADDGTENDLTTINLSIGLFGKTNPADDFIIYYGGRVGYLYEDWNSDDTTHGIRIVPALGMEYYFTERFSLGGEIGWAFEYKDYSATVDAERTSTGTLGRLIARFYF